MVVVAAFVVEVVVLSVRGAFLGRGCSKFTLAN